MGLKIWLEHVQSWFYMFSMTSEVKGEVFIAPRGTISPTVSVTELENPRTPSVQPTLSGLYYYRGNLVSPYRLSTPAVPLTIAGLIVITWCARVTISGRSFKVLRNPRYIRVRLQPVECICSKKLFDDWYLLERNPILDAIAGLAPES